MNHESRTRRWGWKWLFLGVLALAACSAAPESQDEDVPEGTISAMHGGGGRPSPLPTWATPSFASGSVLATDGNQYLVVWRDGGRPGELYAARMSRNGRLLDPGAIRLNPEPAIQAGGPSVAFDGRQFLVVWPGEFTLNLVRVNRDGTVDGPPRTLANIRGDPSSRPGIACSSSKCLVTWADAGFENPPSIRGVLMRCGDKGLDTREVVIASPASFISSFGTPVAWSDNRFLVAWSDSRLGDPKILASRVASDGTVLDPNSILLSDTPGGQTFVDMVATRQGFLVAWSDSRNGGSDIFGTLVRSNGRVPDPDGFPISTGPENDTLPALAYDGQRVLATWTRQGSERFTIRGNLVRPDGRLAYKDSFLLSDDEFVREGGQDVAFEDGKYFMAYGAAPAIDEPPFQVILGTRVKRDGTRVDDPAIRISHSPSVEGQGMPGVSVSR